jgi:Beta-lactamase enzyme family
MIARAFLIWLALLFAVPAVGQTPSAEFRLRADMLVEVLKSGSNEAELFSPSFWAQVPAAQVRAIGKSLVQQYGPMMQVESVKLASPYSGVVQIGHQRAVVRYEMTINTERPYQVIGLLVVGVDQRDDSAQKLIAEFKSLPGKSGLLVTPLGRDGTPKLSHNGDQALAIGSGFKLWILAELARSTRAGERRWQDVVPLGPASLPSGIAQKWPKGTAMTLESLAVMMVSISDNTTTDTLLQTLGRERVGAMVAATGHSAPGVTTPVLSTLEAFALKMNTNADVRARWSAASLQARRALLDREARRLTMGSITLPELGAAPRHIDSVEWFASPADMARTLDWFRLRGGAKALEILAVNPGIPVADAARFSYIGFKGGSEGGVIALNFLVRNKAGEWFAVCGSWNNASAAVDNDRFTSLMIRALALVR